MSFFPSLHLRNLRGDIYGGLTAAVVALPLALAFGVSSGAGPIAGLYGAICVGFFAALFGGTPAQVSGPTGPMTVVMAAVFTEYAGMYPQSPGTGLAMAFTVVMLGGLFQIGFGALRLGRYINLMPYPVISGFMSGIGVIIVLLQLGPLLGHPGEGSPLAAVQALPGLLADPVEAAVVLAGLTLAVVYLLPARINRLLPSPLLALLVGTIGLYLYTGGELQQSVIDGRAVTTLGGAMVIGEIPTGLPSLHLPVFTLEQIVQMVKSGLTLAVLGSIDSLLTSLVADNITRSYHDSDRELVGQGIGNMVAGLLGGLPGAGATMRTVVNVRSGGRTPLSGMLHALVLLIVVLGAGGVAQYIPHAVLAGILVKVGTDIIDWDYLRQLLRAPRSDVIIMFTVLFTTVFVDLITAVAVGVIMASLIFVKRMSDLQLEGIKAVTDPEAELPLSEQERAVMREAKGRILLVHLGGPLSFGAAAGMARRLGGFDHYDVLVLDLAAVTQLDGTAARALREVITGTREGGREVVFAGLRPQVAETLTRLGVLRLLPEGRNCAHRGEALALAARLLKEAPGGGA